MAEQTFFEKRRIQMEYVVPLIKDLREVLGQETVLEALEEVSKLRMDRAQKLQSIDFNQMDTMVEFYAAGDALKYEVIASSADQFDVDVHFCRYAEMMEELGGREFGHLLICNGDFVSAKEMGLELSRSKTVMQGASMCDFRYRPSES